MKYAFLQYHDSDTHRDHIEGCCVLALSYFRPGDSWGIMRGTIIAGLPPYGYYIGDKLTCCTEKDTTNTMPFAQVFEIYDTEQQALEAHMGELL